MSPVPAARPRALARAVVAIALALAASAAVAATGPGVDEAVVHEVAAQLRCVVCQNLSVADSPSETASQMRDIIRERLARGETPTQVRAYFVDKYGIWILLSPPRSGFTLLVWVLPFVGLGLGLVVAAGLIWRWRRPRRDEAAEGAPDAAMRERIHREMADLDP